MKKLSEFFADLLGSKNTDVEDSKYKVGQVWSYHTREGEESSKIYIVRVDHLKKHLIFHICVKGLTLRNPHTESGTQEDLPHSPVSQQTLDESVISLVENTKELPDISNGYASWREAFDLGQGGVFSIPVKEIIQYVEDILEESH